MKNSRAQVPVPMIPDGRSGAALSGHHPPLSGAGTSLAERTPESEHLTTMQGAAERIAEVALRLADSAGAKRYQPARVGLDEVLRDARPGALSAAGAQDVVVHVSGNLPDVEVDVAQLGRALTHLVRNAAESHGDEAGEIRVRAGMDPGGSAPFLEVEDDGEGMTPEVLARCHEPLFSTRGLNRGLGLAAVHGIARANGAELELHSRPGWGTRVRLVFPPAFG